MEYKWFRVTYCPFDTSTLTAVIYVSGRDEEDARRDFARRYPYGNLLGIEAV